jgi:hypothetical protein
MPKMSYLCGKQEESDAHIVHDSQILYSGRGATVALSLQESITLNVGIMISPNISQCAQNMEAIRDLIKIIFVI